MSIQPPAFGTALTSLRDQAPVGLDHPASIPGGPDPLAYQLERRALAAEWQARRPDYADFGKWMLAATYALRELDDAFERQRQKALRNIMAGVKGKAA